METLTESKENDELPRSTSNMYNKKEWEEQFNSVKSIEAPKQSASEIHTFATSKKVVKVLTMIVVFSVVLTATVVSKVISMFSTHHVMYLYV